MITAQPLYSSDAFLNRIAVEAQERPVMFVLGSPLTSPEQAGERGVPGVNGIIDLVRKQLSGIYDLDAVLSGPSSDRYYQALEVLNAYLEEPTRLIRRAVLMDRLVEDSAEMTSRIVQGEHSCITRFEYDVGNWHLGPGLEAIGRLIVGKPDVFGRVVLTSNFDPLIEISVRRAGGDATSIGIATDAHPDIVAPSSCRIIHFHGFWSGSGTLHRPDQLKQNRPQLLEAMCTYLREYTCVVLAYGGWDDIFMEALRTVLSSRSGSPRVFWAHFNADPDAVKRQQPPMLHELDRISRSRDVFIPYYGIDVNHFLPRLFDRLGRPNPDRFQIRIPSADERVQPPTQRVVASLAQEGPHGAPQYPDLLWGVDRGRFLGLINVSRNVGVYESLVQTEGRIQHLTQTVAGLTTLPTRWWLRLDASRLASRVNAFEAIDDAGVDPHDPRLKYLRSKGTPPAVQLGAFLEMPPFKSPDEAVTLLARCIELIEKAVGRVHLFGVVAQWLQVPDPHFCVTAERSRTVWPTLAVDGLNENTKSMTEIRSTPHVRRQADTITTCVVPPPDFELLGAESRAVELFALGQLPEATFVLEHGICAFALALRRGLSFPAMAALASQIDLSYTDFWWLVTRLEPTPARLRQILELPAPKRAAWGLCSSSEWGGFHNYVRAQVIDVRQGRPLVFERN